MLFRTTQIFTYLITPLIFTMILTFHLALDSGVTSQSQRVIQNNFITLS